MAWCIFWQLGRTDVVDVSWKSTDDDDDDDNMVVMSMHKTHTRVLAKDYQPAWVKKKLQITIGKRYIFG